MNNRQFEYITSKINKFSSRAHVYAWHNNALLNIEHRFSLRRSVINFNSRYANIPHPNNVYILASNNDTLLISSRTSGEVEEWKADPNDLYNWLVGDTPIFALEWEIITEIPTSLLKPVLEIFETYYGTLFEYPTLTIAIPHRIFHETHNGKVIYLPNANLFPIEYKWALAMQRAHIDGREIPPRPEITLCERLQHKGLFEGLEWNGEGAE